MPTVHIIDDDEAVRDALAALFTVEGLEVFAYPSAEAFRAGLALDPGCLVTDLHMDGVSGLELVGDLRAAGLRLRAVLITGRIEPVDLHTAESLGGVEVLAKPFSADDIIAAVRRALGTP